jgi:hypothetical protein
MSDSDEMPDEVDQIEVNSPGITHSTEISNKQKITNPLISNKGNALNGRVLTESEVKLKFRSLNSIKKRSSLR